MKLFCLFEDKIQMKKISKSLHKYELEYQFLYVDKGLDIKANTIVESFNPDYIMLIEGYTNIDDDLLLASIKLKYPKSNILYVWRGLSKLNVLNILKIDGKTKVLSMHNKDLIKFLNKNCKTLNNIKETILFVDDSELSHKIIDDYLSNDYNLIHAYDGIEGIESFNNNSPDLIITDINMPNMDGYEFCYSIKSKLKDSYIPIIIISNLDSPEAFKKGFDAGADEYLSKPINKDILNDKISFFLHAEELRKNSQIFLIGDNKIITDAIKYSLQKHGFPVTIFKHKNQLSDIFFKENPDLIILDLNINDDYLTTFSNISKERNIPVIGISKNIDSELINKYGLTKHIKEPFEIKKLLLAVDNTLLNKFNQYKRDFTQMIESMQGLIKALEARDTYTKGHTERVSKLSVALAKYMEISPNEIKQVELGAKLHDIGKIGIRDNILFKDSKLNEDEYNIIKTHPVIGAEILMPIKTLKDIIPFVLYHHEKWDGTGYPSKLKGDKIPIGARIISLCDAFDAITSRRPYQDNIISNKAVEIIKKEKGTHFCPTTTDKFLEMIEKIDLKKYMEDNKVHLT